MGVENGVFFSFFMAPLDPWNRKNLKSVGNASRFFRFEIFLSELGWSCIDELFYIVLGKVETTSQWKWGKTMSYFFGYIYAPKHGVPKNQQRVIVSVVESHLDFRYTQFWDTHSWSFCWRFGERSSLPKPRSSLVAPDVHPSTTATVCGTFFYWLFQGHNPLGGMCTHVMASISAVGKLFRWGNHSSRCCSAGSNCCGKHLMLAVCRCLKRVTVEKTGVC